MKATGLATFLSLLAFPTVTPALTPVGGAIKVGTMDAFSQQVAMRADGGFMVAWTRSGGGTLPQGAFARIYTATGKPESPEIQLNAHLRDFPNFVSVGTMKDGTFIAVYNSKRAPKSLLARHFNTRGRPDGAVTTLSLPDLDTLQNTSVGIRGDGSIAVAYQSRAGTAVRVFDASGQLLGQEASLGSAASRPTFAIRADGAFLTVWSLASAGFELQGQVFDRDGTSAGPFAISDPFPASGASLVGFGAAPLDDGGFVVTWSVLTQTQNSFLRHIGPDGSPLGLPSPLAIAEAGGGTLAAAAGGGFISVWAEWLQPPACAVRVCQFEANDEALGQPIALAVQPYLCSPTVTGNGGTDFVAAWMGIGNGSFKEPYVALLVRLFHAN
jgi:hypothetical protein